MNRRTDGIKAGTRAAALWMGPWGPIAGAGWPETQGVGRVVWSLSGGEDRREPLRGVPG